MGQLLKIIKIKSVITDNIKDAIIQLDLVNKDVAGLDNRQNDLTDILNKSFNQLDNRQDDLAQKANIDFENLNNRQDDLAKKAVVNFENLNNRQDDLAKKATVNFENLNNRQDDLAKKANIDFEKLNNRQDDLAKKTIGDFENLNNRQDDLAKKATVNFENLNNRQNDLTKITTSSVAQLNNRQNDINKVVLDFTKNSKAQTKNITSIANRLTLSEQGFIELRKLLNEFSQQTSLLSSSLNTVLTNFSSNKSKSKLQTSLIKLNDLCNEMNYASYENVFRGSDKLITERLSYYLKFLKNIKTSNKNYVLDLGCGRGEFVEMLNKNKINALGVDLNKSSVEHAKSKNINVKQADIFKVLKSATPKTLPAISAFHLVEHLTFPELESFLQLTATRLKPGGILLIETPNILNLQVAASDFYKDPTHIRPVHPSMLEYWLKFSGFSKIKIDFLHPFPENERLTIQKGSKIIDKNFDKLNNLIFGARDCAIIAVK